MPEGADAAAVIRRMEALRDSFGDATWQLARARMQALRESSAPDAYQALIRDRFLSHPAVAG
jgi:hypothetical protein